MLKLIKQYHLCHYNIEGITKAAGNYSCVSRPSLFNDNFCGVKTGIYRLHWFIINNDKLEICYTPLTSKSDDYTRAEIIQDYKYYLEETLKDEDTFNKICSLF